MPYISVPRGRAREYSPRALTIYTGCDHDCVYCYNRGRFACDKAVPRKISWPAFEREVAAAKCDRSQVLLSFVGDPYCRAEPATGHTRKALEIMHRHGTPIAILTKGGERCLRDLELFGTWPNRQVKVGATMTFLSDYKRAQWEPCAAPVDSRLRALRALHDAGIWTWVSLEPVIDVVETLRLIDELRPIVDEIRVGRWNHDQRANQTDWGEFGANAQNALLRNNYRAAYIKDDVRKAMMNVGHQLWHKFIEADDNTAGRLYE